MSDAAWFVRDGALVWTEIDLPDPNSNEVVIDVTAAGVNRPDLLQRMGVYPPPAGASEALGLEVAGTVREAGRDVARFKKGDRVMALVPGGGYATGCIADQGSVMPIPEPFTFAEAAAFPETAFTVWTNVFEHGHLAKEERLFIHGATSGIGTMACSIAKARGHEVFGTAGTAEKVAQAEAHGFDKVWNYRDQNWAKEVSDIGGIDVVLDMVGGDYVPKNLSMLRLGGRHVSIAFQRGMEATVGIMDIMQRQLTLTGSTLRARPPAEKSRLRQLVEAELFPLVSVGKLKPLIGLDLSMEEAEQAHQAMQNGRLIGKAVLVRN